MDGGKEVKINGHTYHLKAYDHEAQTIIKDESYMVPPGSIDVKVKLGTLNSLTVYFSLADWDIKDNNGNKVQINPKLDIDGNHRITLINFRKFMPSSDMDELFVEAARLNSLSEAEKKS